MAHRNSPQQRHQYQQHNPYPQRGQMGEQQSGYRDQQSAFQNAPQQYGGGYSPDDQRGARQYGAYDPRADMRGSEAGYGGMEAANERGGRFQSDYDESPRSENYFGQRGMGRGTGTGAGEERYSRDYGRNMGSQQRAREEAYGRGMVYGAQEYPGESRGQYDPDYQQWRDAQIRGLDEDYQAWRTERYTNFSNEFDEWRKGRKESASTGSATRGSDSDSDRSTTGKHK